MANMKSPRVIGRVVIAAALSAAFCFAGCRADTPAATKTKKKASTEKKWTKPMAAASNDYSSGILGSDKLLAALKEVSKEKYPNADDVLVDDYILTEYNPDGTSSTWDDTCVKVLTEKGKRDNRTLAFHYTLPYSKVSLKKLEVIKSSGKTIEIDVAKNSKEMVNASQMSTNIYNPNSKILKINIPGLEIGDAVRYVSLRNTVKTKVPNSWSDYFQLEYTSPIKHLAIEVVSPDELPLAKIEVRDGGKGNIKYKVDKVEHATIHRWDVSNVPRLFPEPNMPPMFSVSQRLLLSTIRSWKDLSNWYWVLCDPHIKAVSPEMKAKIQDIVSKSGPKAIDRIRSIFKFVSQEIHYQGITTETVAPGYEPHDAKDTFASKNGVCRDKATLLVSMLRLAGLKAYPVLIMAGPKKDPNVPNPYFNHAIACVEKPDGSYMLMDPTNENTRALLPAYLCDKSYLVAKPEGSGLMLSPVVPADKNLVKIDTYASLSESGMMIAETSIKFNGINDSAYRGYFARTKPADRKKLFERVIKTISPTARLVEYNIQPSNIRDTSKALQVFLRFVATDILVKGDGRVVLPSPWLGRSVGMVNFVLGKTGLGKRRFPLVTDVTCGVVEHFELDLGNAVEDVVAIPASQPIDGKVLSWNRGLSFKNGVLEGNSEFLLKTVEFSPKQYLTLKSALCAIEYDDRKSPIFLRRGGRMSERDANSIVLNEKTNCVVKNDSEWKTTTMVKRKILTYAGQKRYSNLAIHYNPIWEDAKVEYVKVTAPDGSVKKVSAKETNIMDEPWVGSAPRYPPGKIRVLSVPGVVKNSIVEYKVTRVYKKRPFFSIMRFFRDFDPINGKSLDIIVPEGMKLEVSNKEGKGTPLFSFSVSDDEKRFSWRGGAAPALRYERGMPPLWAFVPSCVVSSGKWSDYAKAVSNTVVKAAAGQKRAEAKTVEILAALAKKHTPTDEITAIRNFVAEKIKLAGPEFGKLPLSCATPADKTLLDGYGNSLDRAILLFSMLKSAGFEPEMVLSGAIPGIDSLKRLDGVPVGGVFTRPLVSVTPADGKPIYLNDTDQYARLGTSPDQDNAALFCSSGKIGKIKVDKKNRTGMDSIYAIMLQPNGHATIKIKRVLRGADFALWNRKYAEMTPEERGRHFQELVADFAQSAKPVGKLRTNFSTYPGVVTFSVEVPRFAVVENNYLYLKLPKSVGDVLGVNSDSRDTPFLIGRARKTTNTYILTLPERYAKKIPIAPPTDSWTLPCGAGSVSVSNDRDIFGPSPKPVMFIQQEVDIRPALISKDEFEMARIVAGKMLNRRTKTLLLEKTEDQIASYEEETVPAK